MNRLIIPTLDATYGDVYLSQNKIISIFRESDTTITCITPAATPSIQLGLSVAEVGSNATYNAFLDASYNAKPGGNATVQIPEGQSITSVSIF